MTRSSEYRLMWLPAAKKAASPAIITFFAACALLVYLATSSLPAKLAEQKHNSRFSSKTPGYLSTREVDTPISPRAKLEQKDHSKLSPSTLPSASNREFGTLGKPAAGEIGSDYPHATKADNQRRAVSDEDWQRYVTSFQAHNAKYNDWCVARLRQTIPSGDPVMSGGVGSQFDQDLYLARNVFASKIVGNEKGFYIDSGANYPELLSNTLLFDVCFGWAGLCVEPNREYHGELIAKRSCTLVPECISNETKQVSFELSGGQGHVTSDGSGTTVSCRRLDEMLLKHADGQSYIDLWSLDVEGYEMTVLESTPWSEISFDAILIESFYLSDRLLDYFMTELGFVKLQQMAIDSLYVKWNQATAWRPLRWNEIWAQENKARDELRAQGKLSAEY